MKNIVFIIVAVFIASCSGSGSRSGSLDSSRLDSDEVQSKNERVEVLQKQIISKSSFYDAEFELFNVNGFSDRATVPGASSWDYKFAIKVKPEDIDKWTYGMTKVNPIEYDFGWTKEIVKRRSAEWIVNSQPEFYTRTVGNVTVIVFRNEGVIFKRVINA